MQMQQVFKAFLVVLMIVSLPVVTMAGPFFSPGEPNGWDNTTPMIETFGGSGIWEYTWTGIPDTRADFDILSVSGDWGSKVWSSGNQWVTPDGSDGNTLSLDENTYADGWFPVADRVGVASESITTWTAVGDWQNQVGGGDWDNANVNTPMSLASGSVYSLTAALTPGSYLYKAVNTGTWDSIGGNSRNLNADNFPFTVPAGAISTTLFVDVLDGTVKVESTIPEPATLALLGLGFGGLLLGWRRKR